MTSGSPEQSNRTLASVAISGVSHRRAYRSWARLALARKLCRHLAWASLGDSGLRYGPDSYGRQQWGILRNGRKADPELLGCDVEGCWH